MTVRRGRRGKQLLNDHQEKKKEDIENLKKRHYVTLCGEFALEEVMDVS